MTLIEYDKYNRTREKKNINILQNPHHESLFVPRLKS